jgi:GMP synthase PP-ATPase subunit
MSWWRQPSRPGLLSVAWEVSTERLNRLRAADEILINELATAGLLRMGEKDGMLEERLRHSPSYQVLSRGDG